MTTLYLDRKGLELRLDGQALALYESDRRVRTVPLALLERIVIRAETVMSSGVLCALADAGTAVIMLSGRQGRRVALVHGRAHNDARIRLAQYEHAHDHAYRLSWAQDLVKTKVTHQRKFLERALAERPDLRKPLSDALDTLLSIQTSLVDGSHGIAETNKLLGIEGAAQAAYFRGFMTLFPESLGFTGRNRRPPRDPVNACLSLGYTLVHFEAVRVAHAAGLDPLIGFFHVPAFGRESLACDLVEPLRPRVDAWVREMFRARLLRGEHFRMDKGACLLDKTGRARFYEQFEPFLNSTSRALRRYCRLMVRMLQENVPNLPDSEDHGDDP